MSGVTDVIEDVVNEALFKDKPEGHLVAWLDSGKWVVIDTEDQTVCLVTVQGAVIIPKYVTGGIVPRSMPPLPPNDPTLT